jgi:hypothetical protein
MGFSSFIQRAGRRLGQLKLLVEQLSKSTDLLHPDHQGSIEMVVDMLHRTVMKGQADGQGLFITLETARDTNCLE